MLWVGGSIIVHSLAGTGWHQPEQLIETVTSRIEQTLTFVPSVTNWLATAFIQALIGIATGGVTILLLSIWTKFTRRAARNGRV
ncbi:DUF808 family protein [Agrobacterium pusense]|uniref:DUF808 family protein n=1 Tax=Agrobacterium pusense TaxID=648995 RepID=UPI003D071E6D